MKTLLYATDYSDNSISALKLANGLRKKFKAKLFVMHVFDIEATFISTVSLAYAKLEEAAFKDHRKRLEEFYKKHIGEDVDDESVKLLVSENSIPSQKIADTASELNANMILVGMKGSSAVREFLIGSTASALIGKASVPVLAVPEEFADESIQQIVYATDFEEADIIAIQEIVVLAKAFGAKLKLLHVSTKDEYAGEDQLQWFKEMLSQRVDYTDMEFEVRFSEDIFNCLTEYVEEVKPQLLVMLEREGYHLISDIWHRDLVKRMKLGARVPLMSFHKKHLQPI